VSIEAATAVVVAKTMILPASIRYQGQLAEAVNATKTAGVDNAAQADLLKGLSTTISDFQKTITALEKHAGHSGGSDPYVHAKHIHEHVLPAMLDVRKIADKLETIVADDLWPLPTYREMLFIK
jgi:glutamine synthetase